MRKGKIIINYGYDVICMETMRKTSTYLGHTVSEPRFKTGNYEIWSPPVFTNVLHVISQKYRGAIKSLARPGRKQAAPVKSVMGKGMD